MKLPLPSAIRLAIISATALIGAPLIAQGIDALEGDDDAYEILYYDYLDDAGNLAGGRLIIPRQERFEGVVPADYTAPVTTIIDNGPPLNRVNLVTVGDGYIQSELDLYGLHVFAAIDELFDLEPFYTYSTYFNVHQVDVVSNESGVSNDPVPGIDKDTAMDMHFWCNNMERLLCVSVYKASMYAANAPRVDQIFAVANSTKYGGAGYPSSNLGTYAGGNSAAPQIAIHELGHSLGNLADEYDYGGPAHYQGPEPPERNVSKLTHAQMAAAGTKWANWLGENHPAFDGYHTTYEGAKYSQYGIYRPSNNSMMRALNRPFNLPSAEALIIEMYKVVQPIDDATPTQQILTGSDIVFVQPLEPVNAPLDIEWRLDEQPLVGETGETLELASLDLPQGTYELSVIVTDNNWMVRDAAARAQYMTQRLDWTVEIVVIPGDINGDGCVDHADLALLLSAYGSGPGDPNWNADADLTGDGTVGHSDLAALLANWGEGCE